MVAILHSGRRFKSLHSQMLHLTWFLVWHSYCITKALTGCVPCGYINCCLFWILRSQILAVWIYWQCACVGTMVTTYGTIIGNVLVLEPWLLLMEQNDWQCACVGTMVTTYGTELLEMCWCWNHGYYRWNRIILELWTCHFSLMKHVFIFGWWWSCHAGLICLN